MEAIACIEGRRSIRSFTDQEISNDILKNIVKSASFAPSWKNTQTVSYIAVKDQTLKGKLASIGIGDFVKNQETVNRCNCLVAVVTKKGISGYNSDGTPTTTRNNLWETFDAGIATQTFCLAAHNYNVGTVILGIYEENKILELLELNPNEYSISALVACGYYNVEAKAPKRKSVEDLLTII